MLRGVETPPFLLDSGAALLLGGCKKSHNRQRHNELQEREYKIATFIAAFFVDTWNGPGWLSVLHSFHSVSFLLLQIFLYLLLRCCSETMKAKAQVRLRRRKMKGGGWSLYLDIYHAGIRRYEYLRLYLAEERTPEDRQKNSETLRLAEAVAAAMEAERTNDDEMLVRIIDGMIAELRDIQKDLQPSEPQRIVVRRNLPGRVPKPLGRRPNPSLKKKS